MLTPESVKERALNAAHDYLISILDRDPQAAEKDRSEGEIYSHQAIIDTAAWYSKSEQMWIAAGRINSMGYLRVDGHAPRWTIATIKELFPKADGIACLIALDGIIQETEMKEIVSLIRQIVREEVQLVFSESIAERREIRSPLYAGRACDGAGRRKRKRSENL